MIRVEGVGWGITHFQLCLQAVRNPCWGSGICFVFGGFYTLLEESLPTVAEEAASQR